ncbi:MAG: hypothetical protein ACK5PS_19855 [Desulfopila sp.]
MMKTYTNEEIVDAFLDHTRYLRVVHHVPGRIRVKANWHGAKKLAKVDRDDLGAVIGKIPGIYGYRLNAKALSVIIEYDTATLPFDLWNEVGILAEKPLGRENVKARLLTILTDNTRGK